MDGKELLEQALRRGIPLRRIEDELDRQENQGVCCAADVGCGQREPIVCCPAQDAVLAQQSAVLRELQALTAVRRPPWRWVFFLFCWFFNQVMLMMRFRPHIGFLGSSCRQSPPTASHD